MAAITKQRDLVVELKKETLLNLGILSKLHGMPQDPARLVFKENALEKPTQALFNEICYYLVRIIDPRASQALPWPIYDSKTERAYRNELANFICQYSKKGLLSPVLTSYLVNPGCFKVTLLIFQMTTLAVKKVLESIMSKECQKKRYTEMTTKFKSEEKECFLVVIEKETKMILSKFSNCQHRRKAMEKIAEKFHLKIVEMESKLANVNVQNFFDNIIDEFLSKHKLDDEQKADILKIKDIETPAPFFDRWLSNVDRQLDDMNSKWTEKITPFLQLCKETENFTEMLIARHTGEADKDSYMVEYNHKTDKINTTDLQNHVNSQQKYILKNIVKDEKLNIPNLIRGFLIAIGFIINGEKVGDEIYQFNQYLEGGQQSFSEVVMELREVLTRVMNAEAKLQVPPVTFRRAVSLQNFPEIPPLPDLSSIKSTKALQGQALFDSFTPLGMSNHQFNLQRRSTVHNFVKPQSRLLFTSFCQGPREDFFKCIQSSRVNLYDHLNSTQNFHNISIISNRANETIAGLPTGCTKEQLQRLLSTKKSSSNKKFKRCTERPNIRIKKGGLFNESNSSNESIGIYRSHSSPNLYENRQTRLTERQRKLSIMQESNSPVLEVSGIAMLDKDSSCEKSQPINLDARSVLNVVYQDVTSISTNSITPVQQKFHSKTRDFNIDLNKEFLADPPKRLSTEFESKVTPQNNIKPIQKTRSLEKIINRYKKVQANVLSGNSNASNDIRTIFEEKENMFTACKVLLPDLLSPSCKIAKNPGDSLDQDTDLNVRRRPRESLGTMLDVDHTFLDQFDLID